MNKKYKLNIELVPASAWGNNLRSILKPHMWKTIREGVYKKAGNRCEICNTATRRAESSGRLLHAHEVWDYDDKGHVQNLVGIIALCKKCHAVKHFGYTELADAKGEVDKEKVIQHFMKVNKCSREDFMKHKVKAQEKFEERSRYDWQIDLRKYTPPA